MLNEESRRLLNEAYEKYSLSMRAYNKIIKVSRTLADLEGCRDIEIQHVAEALMYRIDDEAR